MRFDASFLDKIREVNDIESVVAPYVSLRPAGRLRAGLCPFHGEKSPSFYIYPESQSYYCFGCGAGGDVITFVRTIENLSYVDAVKLLADRGGIRMPDNTYDEGLDKLKKRCLAANREAARFFHAQLFLPSGQAGLNYLLGRGLQKATIRRFGLGFAPDDWRPLTEHLKQAGFREDELVQFNLARQSKNGRCYDAFRNRVMFPIIDLQGNVIAFGGRVMDDAKPKYLNTSDTIAYKKSKGVFALNFAKNSAEKKLILCEGYMDVIALHQAGFTNAVAGLGTALTEDQALLLSRYADDIYICYDSDEAGVKAADKAVKIFEKTNVKIKVLRLSGGKDPDEIIKKHGPEKMRNIINGALNDTEFKLAGARADFDLSVEDGKLSYANAAIRVLSAISNDIERDLYSGRIAEETGIAKQAIVAQTDKQRRAAKKQREQKRFSDAEKQMNGYAKSDFYPPGTPVKVRKAEELLLASLLRNPDFYKTVCGNLHGADFISDTNRIIYRQIAACIDADRPVEMHMFNELLTSQEMGHLSKLYAEKDALGNTPKECADCIRVMKDSRASAKKNDLSKLSDEEFLNLFRKNN